MNGYFEYIKMEARQRKIINDNLENLVNVTENLDAMLNILLENKTINTYMVKYIMSFDDRKGKLCSFYKLIQGRGPKAFRYLRDCLRKTHNIKRVMECVSSYGESVEILSENVSSSSKMIESRKIITGGDITIHPDKKFMDIEDENLPNGVYRMRSKPRGYALVVNINKCSGMPDRDGSEIDFQKITNLFKGLGYVVVPHVDLNNVELENAVRSFSKNPRLSKVDSVAVCIMSHGTQKENTRSTQLITSNGLYVNTDWIVEQFTIDSSSLITNASHRKPKMFFFQACRGNKTDVGREYDDQTRIDSVPFSAKTRGVSSRRYEDVITVWSTINGYYSKRHPEQGGWFVNVFCQIISENAWRYDLETMIGQVNEKMRPLNSPIYGHQTAETIKQGLSKKIYFNPGLYEEEGDEDDGDNSHDVVY